MNKVWLYSHKKRFSNTQHLNIKAIVLELDERILGLELYETPFISVKGPVGDVYGAYRFIEYDRNRI